MNRRIALALLSMAGMADAAELSPYPIGDPPDRPAPRQAEVVLERRPVAPVTRQERRRLARQARR